MKILADLLREVGCGRSQSPVLCPVCETNMESRGLREKTIETILGPVPFSRTLFQCPSCTTTRYPGDEILNVVSTTRSPGLRRMMSRAGSRTTFKEAHDDLKVYAGIEVSAKDVERVAEAIGEEIEVRTLQERELLLKQDRPIRATKTIPVLYISYDGTGVPMVPSEVAGRKGKQPDGTALTREAKLGCVFTQTSVDAEGLPIRDPSSTSFVGHIESSENFGYRIYAEALRRGLDSAQEVVIIADGAEWIWNVADLHFPAATQIVDLFHARQHVSDLCKILHPSDETARLRLRGKWWDYLDAGKVESILLHAHNSLPQDTHPLKACMTELAYLEKNKSKMRYADFRNRHLFVGSGVIEAGCKSIIGLRLKRSGMEWSVRGANAIISLRCAMLSGRMEEFWEPIVA